MLFIIVINDKGFISVKALSLFGSSGDHKTCFLPLYSYEIEIRNSLLGSLK